MAQSPSRPPTKDIAQAVAEMEAPRVKWKVIAQIVAGFAVLWVTAFMTQPYVGPWGLIIVGALTIAAAGFGLYVWRLTQKSQRVMDILKGATDEAGRKAALAQLEQGDAKDALNALARAQLLARESPSEAIAVLEAIDLKKAPLLVQDDVRANLALVYLSTNRAKEARALADEIHLDRQANVKARAVYAGVIAEAFARTGKAEDAKKLLETYKAEDPEFGDARAVLLRAQVYTYFQTKNRGLAKGTLKKLAEIDPNALGAFLQRGVHPELQQLAKDVLLQSGAVPRPKMKMRMQ